MRNFISGQILSLIIANIFAWMVAFVVFKGDFAHIGICFLAFTYGLRHGLDSDHIAAIDSVTRKLIEESKSSKFVGLFFSLGHSSIVIIITFFIALGTTKYDFSSVRGAVGMSISAIFLLGISFVNFSIFLQTLKRFRNYQNHVREPVVFGGALTKLFNRFFKFVDKPYKMLFIGFIFGLGFDTSTGIGLLGISFSATNEGISPWAIMVFPLLFTTAMSLVDCIDSELMVRVYAWGEEDEFKKLYYSLSIILISTIIAFGIGFVQAFNAIIEVFNLENFDLIVYIGNNMGRFGYMIVILFVVFWVGSISLYNYKYKVKNNKLPK